MWAAVVVRLDKPLRPFRWAATNHGCDMPVAAVPHGPGHRQRRHTGRGRRYARPANPIRDMTAPAGRDRPPIANPKRDMWGRAACLGLSRSARQSCHQAARPRGPGQQVGRASMAKTLSMPALDLGCLEVVDRFQDIRRRSATEEPAIVEDERTGMGSTTLEPRPDEFDRHRNHLIAMPSSSRVVSRFLQCRNGRPDHSGRPDAPAAPPLPAPAKPIARR